MRRLFIPACIVTGLCVVLLALSLFRIQWISPGFSTRVVLQRAALRVWVGSKDDWIAFQSPWGLDYGGWSGGQAVWKPKVQRAASIFVPAGPAPIGTAVVTAKRITGLEVIVPWYLPLLLGAAGSMLTFFPWRRRRRLGAGLCGRCGYDLAGLSDRCPECGSAIARLLAAIGSWARSRRRVAS